MSHHTYLKPVASQYADNTYMFQRGGSLQSSLEYVVVSLVGIYSDKFVGVGYNMII